MKPPDVPWFEYLQGYASLRWRNPGDEQRYHAIWGQLHLMYEIYYSNLLNRPGPKHVFATRTPLPVQNQGHPPWTFKVQCQITGRISTAIPYERMPEFGIFSADTQTGGPFPKGPDTTIEDRMKPLYDRLWKDLDRVCPTRANADYSWHERYSEYLRSDQWLDLRRKVLIRDRFRCQWTGKASAPGDPLQVHHLTYVRLGCEDMDDLITVCRSAHKHHHHREAAE